MVLLKMMLRLFTTIFGATHPKKEEESKYAWMLFVIVILIVLGMVGVVWLVVKIM